MLTILFNHEINKEEFMNAYLKSLQEVRDPVLKELADGNYKYFVKYL
jgi:hypothetical protein